MIDKQIIREFLMKMTDKTQIGDDDSLLATKMLDSLNVVELISFLEDHFKVALDDDELSPENLDSVNAIANLIEHKGVS